MPTTPQPWVRLSSCTSCNSTPPSAGRCRSEVGALGSGERQLIACVPRGLLPMKGAHSRTTLLRTMPHATPHFGMAGSLCRRPSCRRPQCSEDSCWAHASALMAYPAAAATTSWLATCCSWRRGTVHVGALAGLHFVSLKRGAFGSESQGPQGRRKGVLWLVVDCTWPNPQAFPAHLSF